MCPGGELAGRLYEKSGIPEIKDVIDRHFVARSSAIRAHQILTKLEDACHELLNSRLPCGGVAAELVQYLLARLREIWENEQSFPELEMLQYYYNSELQFADESEEEEFLCLAGERGNSLRDRLGCPEGSVDEMMHKANERAKYWYGQAALRAPGTVYGNAARTLGRMCETLLFYLRRAQP